MSFSSIVGHQRAIRVLRRALAGGRVPHAYLFWGPDGVGKEKVADAVARILLCGDPSAVEAAEACGRCRACREMGAGDHPDLHRLVAPGATIPVAAVREFQETLGYRSFERGRKVVILRDGFRMTREASNALLKTLEEPPAGTHIFVLAHHRHQLLPTLVSRCQALRFDPLPETDVERVLEGLGVEPTRARNLAACAGGCPGAVWGGDPEELLAREVEAGDLADRWGSLTAAERFALAGRWAADREGLRDRLGSLERALARCVRRKAFEGDADPGALDRLEGVVRVRGWLDRNVNLQLALDALFLEAAGKDWEDRACDR